MERELSNRLNPEKMPAWCARVWGRKNYLNVLAGINDDDCAVMKVGKETIVISCDFLNANPITIELGIGSYKELGRILVAANLSDLCGSGAKPICFLAGVMLKKLGGTEDNFRNLMKGVIVELRKHNIPLVGGDTKLGNSNNFYGVAVGIKEKGTKLFLKRNAKVGDDIWVSGNLGSVGAAIDGLKNYQMPEKWISWAKKKITIPEIPLSLSRVISKQKLANSGTDLSDGLAADLINLCNASNVGAIIFSEKIPIAKKVKEIARKKKAKAWSYSLTIGGDFQFLFTSKKANASILWKLGAIKIGTIIKEKKHFIKINDQLLKLPSIGHSDFNTTSFSTEVVELLKKINEIYVD